MDKSTLPSEKSGLPKQGFAKALVAWYQQNARTLPWRETKDPYAIWVSEIMLQQTQVNTVIPYYHRFLERFPTIQTLAAANEDHVLKLWEGLGYYARARNLQKAARQMVVDHGGDFPHTLEEAETLTGIGRSTAGAILTFSRGQAHPLLDGNVKRVLSRLYDIDQPVSDTAVLQKLWHYSADLLGQSTDSYSFNQAIMELGAVLCTQKTPSCLICPVQAYCDAKDAGSQAERPVKVKKKPIKHHHIGAAVIWHPNGQILIQQRPKEGLLGGLWEFPGGKQEPDESIEVTVLREIEEELGIAIEVGQKVAAVKHAYTHFKITLHAFYCRYVSGEPVPRCADDWAWVKPENLRDYAFPKANHPVIDHILSDNEAKQGFTEEENQASLMLSTVP